MYMLDSGAWSGQVGHPVRTGTPGSSFCQARLSGQELQGAVFFRHVRTGRWHVRTGRWRVRTCGALRL